MAKTILNAGLNEIRGGVDGFVYKVVRGKRVIARRPKQNPNRLPTATELETRERFQKADAWAKTVQSTPALRTIYQQRADFEDMPLRAVAVRDYYRAPKILGVKTSGYHGRVSDPIVITAIDDVAVATVSVVIRDNATHAVLEQGPADPAGSDWQYLGKSALPAGHAVTIEVTATDYPGNATKQEVVYP